MITKKKIPIIFCLLFLLLQVVGWNGCGGSIPPISMPTEECELENPDPIEEEYECQTSCESESSCSGDWHLEEFGSCTYSCGPFWLDTCYGGYCCPNECDDMNGYVCEEGEVCPDDWLFPLAGEGKDKCCSVKCVLPCCGDDKTSSISGLECISETGIDIETFIDDADESIESESVQALIDAGGTAVCLDECPDFKYAVEGEQESVWCYECAEPAYKKCCAYCPPQTVYYEKEGCGPTRAISCGDASGLPFSGSMSYVGSTSDGSGSTTTSGSCSTPNPSSASQDYWHVNEYCQPVADVSPGDMPADVLAEYQAAQTIAIQQTADNLITGYITTPGPSPASQDYWHVNEYGQPVADVSPGDMPADVLAEYQAAQTIAIQQTADAIMADSTPALTSGTDPTVLPSGNFESGFSICQVECTTAGGTEEDVYTGYTVSAGNQWCKEMYGGTDLGAYKDFTGYSTCCAYCPSKTVYINGECTSLGEPMGECNIKSTLNCPYVILNWRSCEGYYGGVSSFTILPFYDDNHDKETDGTCKEVIIPSLEHAYDLGLSECTDHLQGNIRFLVIPNNPSLDELLTDWIDVSICNIGSTDITNIENCTNNKDDDDDGLIDCKDTADCPEGTICNEEGTKTCQLGICKLTESELELEEEHNDDLTGTKDDYDGDGTINEDDSDKDDDGVDDGPPDNPWDKQEWTIIGCEVDDNGVAIDKDEDGICKGIDCKDNDDSIKITKDDDACTTEMLCSNEEKDTKTNEIEIDLGGSCRPYIELVQPEYGVSESDGFDLVISTDHDATCRYSIDVVLKYAYMNEFTSSEGTTHTKEELTLNDESKHKLYVRCDDETWSPEDSVSEFELYVDSSNPVITTYYADPNPIIEKPVETALVVGTDDETICKYDLTEQEYNSMSNKFDGFEEHEFSESHQETKSLLADAKDYTYYIACENRAGLVSDTKEIIVSVDLSQDLVVTSTTKAYTNESSIYLSVKTNKAAQCFYNNVSTKIEELFNLGDYEHKKRISPLADGNYHYYVRCYSEGKQSPITTVIFTVDTAPVETPEVDDTSNIDDYPEYSYYTDRLRVKWEIDEKPPSGIDYYLYMLEDELGNITVNWTQSDEEDEWVWVDEDHNGDELNLTKGTKYFFSVIAKNRAGSSSEIGRSDGVIVDPSKKPVSCSDLELSGDETDIDCGGSCPKCELNKNCLVNDDCHSGFCNSSNKCAKSSCDDGIKNGDETDVDCGGSCNKCDNNEDCKKNSDCKSGKCDSNLKICIGVDKCSNNKLDVGETDIDCGGDKCPKCDDGQDCKKNSDCESNNCENGYCVKKPVTVGVPITTIDDEDRDGMPDDWEEKYGLDSGYDDAGDDEDNDGLTNLQEYKEGTDPTNRDTDGDGVSDGDEVEKGFDPTDSDSRPASIWPIILLIIGIILLVSGIGYLLYKNFTKPKQKKPFKPFTPVSPIRPGPAIRTEQSRLIETRRRQAMEKIMGDRERFKEHDKIFDTFAAQPKTDIKERLHGRLDIGKPKTAPKKIKAKKPVKKQAKKPRDVFEELSKVATTELKKYKKK